MPMLIPFMFFITYGIENITNKTIKNNKAKTYVKMFIIIVPAILSIDCVIKAIQYYMK